MGRLICTIFIMLALLFSNEVAVGMFIIQESDSLQDISDYLEYLETGRELNPPVEEILRHGDSDFNSVDKISYENYGNYIWLRLGVLNPRDMEEERIISISQNFNEFKVFQKNGENGILPAKRHQGRFFSYPSFLVTLKPGENWVFIRLKGFLPFTARSLVISTKSSADRLEIYINAV
ncbi:MAG: hypothetical protein HQK54_14775, partial [Oligoflexales bacterium]|nr:hypothetical protein [Oligoflexales bacterium]